MTDSAAAADPSVCYRHPDRQSWVLCQRCGRTICPECQILAPVGVQCPECVREAGGSVRWQSTGSPLSSAAKRRSRPRWVQSLLRLMHPDSDAPVLTYGILGISVLLWLIGFFTDSLPFNWLAAAPVDGLEWQIWRYFTSVLTFPSRLDPSILSFLLSGVFFFLIAPSAERTFGRSRFLLVFVSGAVVGSAASVALGSVGFGFSGALFGLLAGFFIVQRSMGGVGTQLLIIIALNVMISVLFGGNLAMLFGGLIGGALAAFILGRFEYRARSKPATPVALIVAIWAVAIIVATVRIAVVPALG
ncbi:rhomboid family intramembrane serine protease [Schumannella sp. 10F1B-5-1]|uniref:rhomboid family intramembrane serine protease n=1 Tax=Schumannella sp. 10F1B-5-1 TaxID=2590780 RepID=UPI0011306213|nr:rhomboid family intramembrane serine protease [Schumannella sp. 10F1B-5-1]TPW76735.1 rhomboid family intramembrane serine protease [Schumannella sp. 10F1B-5-1]